MTTACGDLSRAENIYCALFTMSLICSTVNSKPYITNRRSRAFGRSYITNSSWPGKANSHVIRQAATKTTCSRHSGHGPCSGHRS